MSSDDPISLWIEDLQGGDNEAAQKIWNHFAARLCAAARQKIAPDTRRVYDEEDAAQSAFHSLCRGISAKRFPDLRDRDGLWRLMLVITARKVSHRHRYDHQQCRTVQRTANDSIFSNSESGLGRLEMLVSREPTPEFTAEFLESCDRLFEKLDDSQLQQIGMLKLEGFTDIEVAQRLGCSRRTVQRRLEIIRRIWSDEAIAT